jgi:hypothetical protein
MSNSARVEAHAWAEPRAWSWSWLWSMLTAESLRALEVGLRGHPEALHLVAYRASSAQARAPSLSLGHVPSFSPEARSGNSPELDASMAPVWREMPSELPRSRPPGAWRRPAASLHSIRAMDTAGTCSLTAGRKTRCASSLFRRRRVASDPGLLRAHCVVEREAVGFRRAEATGKVGLEPRVFSRLEEQQRLVGGNV